MDTAPSPVPLAAKWRIHWGALRAYARAPSPPPDSTRKLDLFVYGFAQSFLGLRTVVRSHDLLGIALAPALGVLLIAGLFAYRVASVEGPAHGVGAFLLAVAALAPLPSLLFGRVYAHFAAKARPHLGLPPEAPYLRGIVQLVGEWLAQVMVLALGVLPYVALARLIPLLGPLVAFSLQAAWALHWIVVEGYDNARTLPEGRTIAELEARAQRQGGRPWFDRWHHTLRGPRWLVVVLAPLRMLSEVTTALARSWRSEVDLVERTPWISLGFGLGAASMLAVPGLNLLFRPAVVVAGVHLRHQLHIDDDDAAVGARASGAVVAVDRPQTAPSPAPR